MRRDRAIGFSLIIIALTVTPFYLLLVSYPWQVLEFLGISVNANTGWEIRIYCAVIPIGIIFTFFLVVGAWMGFNILMSPSEEESKSNVSDRIKPKN